MKVKEVKPINFLFYRTETTLSVLAKFLPVGQELYREAVAKMLTVTGPIHWHYVGFVGNPDTAFTLEISLPVAETLPDYDGRFHFKRTEPFRCISAIHEGPWDKMLETYGSVFASMDQQQLRPAGVNREIYINSDFAHPGANTTEIQVGVI